jgi:hypothetical protein
MPRWATKFLQEMQPHRSVWAPVIVAQYEAIFDWRRSRLSGWWRTWSSVSMFQSYRLSLQLCPINTSASPHARLHRDVNVGRKFRDNTWKGTLTIAADATDFLSRTRATNKPG